MKKILVGSIVFLIAVIVFLSYKLYFKETPVTIADCKTITMNYEGENWESKISIENAKAIAGNYRDDFGKNHIWNGETRSDIEDARSAWFPLETLKRYIWSIETSNCKNGCKDDTLGIRIYYAKYPGPDDTDYWSGAMEGQRPFASYHTLFMVPTYLTPQGHNQDYNPFTENCHERLTDAPGSNKPTKAILSAGDEQNHGSLIPPADPNGTSF